MAETDAPLGRPENGMNVQPLHLSLMEQYC